MLTGNKILKSRIVKLNNVDKIEIGESVIYIMSRDQRLEYNHAFIASLKHCVSSNVKPIIIFNLYSSVQNRAYQHYEWMIEGLKELEQECNKLGIKFCVNTNGKKGLLPLIDKLKPLAIYFDFSPLVGPTKYRNYLAKILNIPCYLVDTHNIVPVWIASQKEEYSAATYRPKVHKLLNNYLTKSESISNFTNKLNLKPIENENEWDKVLQTVAAKKLNNYRVKLKSGGKQAKEILRKFIDAKLINYSTLRNNPTRNFQSDLSAYLHFGQISSLEVALALLEFAKAKDLTIKFGRTKDDSFKLSKSNNLKDQLTLSIESFLEELIVRKELADNFCFYNKNYKTLNGVRDWARQTLADHFEDKRDYTYSYTELVNGLTHDSAWNKAQRGLITSGKMHGYMRMYWAKKIFEWTPDAETAIDYCIKINDSYELDGYDPNGYVGILWSIGGLHDRPWAERSIFGKIRYMNFSGLKRKFDVDEYLKETGS